MSDYWGAEDWEEEDEWVDTYYCECEWVFGEEELEKCNETAVLDIFHMDNLIKAHRYSTENQPAIVMDACPNRHMLDIKRVVESGDGWTLAYLEIKRCILER